MAVCHPERPSAARGLCGSCYGKEYYAAHREQHGASQREYREANKDEVHARQRRWRQANPEKVREASRRYAERHAGRVKERARRWAAAHGEERREYRLEYDRQRQYGISRAEYETMAVAQGHRCAICREPETSKHQSGRTKLLAVDHDHATGIVRALLCHACNTGIGSLGDDPARLERAADYLRAFALVPA